MNYSLRQNLRGKNLVVVGGTGFLGKVWLSLLLTRFPELGHIYLVVRPKEGQGVHQRFLEKIIGSEVFHPLRETLGSSFESYVDGKVTPMEGDVRAPLCGINAELRAKMRGRIAAVVNVAGIVDFAPPLDEALEVNAFGCQNLVNLAVDLGAQGILHTSTCYTAGRRTGPIAELDPREVPFPRADELDRSDWSPDREIAECLDVIEQARHRAGDAFRQSRFRDEASQNLRSRNEPTTGKAFEDEITRVRRKFIEAELAELGTERARYWGWPNTYTYTKSIGEQIIASSGIPNTIVRPAIVESTLAFPFPGWNEGINTSSPIIFLIREGGLQVPGSDNHLDFIPCDLVAAAITLALGEVIEGNPRPVYQAASSDTNPCTMARFFELSGLYKRRYYQRTQRGGPIWAKLQEHYESALLNREEYELYGPHRLARGAEFVSNWVDKFGRGPARPLARPLSTGLQSFAKGQRKLARVMDTFLPFVAEYHYTFETKATRAAFDRLSPEEQALVPFRPQDIDWRHWFLEIHAPALERHVFPLMEQRLKKKARPPIAYSSLTDLFNEITERFDLVPWLQQSTREGLVRVSFRAARTNAEQVGAWLQRHGVAPGDRILLAGANGPAWPIAFFGILAAGATVVPLDPELSLEEFQRITEASYAKAAILGAPELKKWSSPLATLELERVLNLDEPHRPAKSASNDDIACLIYTSGTTGIPKGVMLSHGNITALVAALAPLFPLAPDDRLVSVLPLHHTFELTCGLLLPLSRGSRVTYLAELGGEPLLRTLKETRATALIGVPALWELLERRILGRVRDKGTFHEQLFDAAIEVSRGLGKATGLDVGRVLFGTVHRELGGQLRYLVSGGAALNEETHALFQGLGLHLSEGYGLTEAAPVLTVAPGGPRARPGHVGSAIPGVELRIDGPGPDGVGEVLARGPNVMRGYADNADATRQSLDADGWLRTGDLGTLDHRGRLSLVGRKKDVVVAGNGENLYPDDIENELGTITGLSEFCLLGIADKRGGERLCLAGTLAAGASEDSARRNAERAYQALRPRSRPALTYLSHDPLPRTSTKKVRRTELRRLIEAQEGRNDQRQVDITVSDHEALLLEAVARVARRQPSDIRLDHTLRGDLGFDSLQALELLGVLEGAIGRTLDAERLASATTVRDLAEHLTMLSPQMRSRTDRVVSTKSGEIEFSPIVRRAGHELIDQSHDLFYSHVLDCEITGQAHIPHNQNVLVVANHASHLDMGLVKYALGTYGEGLATLAAQDYFFEGSPLKRAVVTQMTDLVPISRTSSLRGALRHTGELLAQGRTVLVFPEGTRSADGRLREFKAAFGHLALHHKVDVLPIWLGGTYSALPRGARFLRRRKVEARIGAPLRHTDLLRYTDGLPGPEAARLVARLTEMAVLELSRSGQFDLLNVDLAELRRSVVPATQGLTDVFDELRARFVTGVVDEPVSYYFSLGDERWTVRATSHDLSVAQGKTVGEADCVLKTTPDLFERIIREAYVPGPGEFLSGAIKTSNVAHLMKMQKLFQLNLTSTDFWASRRAVSSSSLPGLRP